MDRWSELKRAEEEVRTGLNRTRRARRCRLLTVSDIIGGVSPAESHQWGLAIVLSVIVGAVCL